MSEAVICPVCKGAGVVPDEVKYTYTDGTATGGITGASTYPSTKVCHGCGGKGWVEVGASYPPYYPPVYPWNPTITWGRNWLV